MSSQPGYRREDRPQGRVELPVNGVGFIIAAHMIGIRLDYGLNPDTRLGGFPDTAKHPRSHRRQQRRSVGRAFVCRRNLERKPENIGKDTCLLDASMPLLAREAYTLAARD